MSKPSRRPNRAARKVQREKKTAEKALRLRQIGEGLRPTSRPSSSNATSPYKTVAEEAQARTQAASEQARLFKAQLPSLLKQLSCIPDPRNPKKVTHQLTTLLLYGLLMFVYQYTSRRQVNREMTSAVFMQNLRELFPELDQLPHADTLYRLLQNIDVEAIQDAQLQLIGTLIKNKKFRRYLINNCYPVAIDGTQKLTSNRLWSEQWLQRKKQKSKTKKDQGKQVAETATTAPDTVQPGTAEAYQYYVSVLEANLAFRNGMVIPLLTEFLDYEQGDTDNDKQDCETRAFKRLTERLKAYFPKLPIILLLDGLYANGPIMACCTRNHWQFMIVLRDESLPSVWSEYHSLLSQEADNHHRQSWGARHQQFTWVNGIEYDYGPNDRYKIRVHVVVCEEQWEEINDQGEGVSKRSRHAWLSSRPLHQDNVHQRCNLGARHRWGIEAGFLVEKHQGYAYEHCFARNWNAMKGYHYLMRIAHTLNILARFSRTLKDAFDRLGVRGFITFVRDTLKGPWWAPGEMSARLGRPFQLRLE